MFDEPANDLSAAATLCAVARLDGVGLHTGKDTSIEIKPAAAGAGICFLRTDLEGSVERRTIAADPALVSKTQLGTVLTNDAGVSISTVEHLLAAFAMLGITDARVHCNGPEIPILDGSSREFIEALQAVGTRVFPHTIERIVPSAPVSVELGDAWLRAEPLPKGSGAEIILDVTIDFEHPSIGLQRILIEGDRETIMREVADARTFTELKHVEALQEMGLARGGSLDNAVVVAEHGIMNPEGLRMEREFVRHKALDLLGDLYLLGLPLGCKVTAYKPGHTINTALALALSGAEVDAAPVPISA
ncbi:MAG: UDP-3-O-acyl-N-acetylglucosamine deacetylase [Pseudomonadota bacterium]